MTRRAFTLVEVLLAVFILGIGIISVSALFPAGIVQQRASNDDALGPVVAQHAMGVIRGKVGQDDFGTYEEYNAFDFGLSAPTTIVGDWSWKRPCIYFDQQIPGVGLQNGSGEDDRGVIDIFGVLCRQGVVVNFAAEFGEQGLFGPASLNNLFGIPANRRKWDPDNNVNTELWVDLDRDGVEDLGETREPLFLITQQERYWPAAPATPQSSTTVTPSAPPRPQFVWDCMFRRFEGRVLVAVFVYRVGTTSDPGSGLYRVAQGGTGIPGTTGARADVPPMPRLGAFLSGAPDAALPLSAASTPRASGRDGNATTLADNAIVPGTEPNTPSTGFNITLDIFAWQAPNQLWLDQWNDIHRVVAGRRTNRDGPVTLARPVTTKPSTAALFSYGPDGLSNPDPGQLQLIWYLPTEDANGVAITPVYVTVMEL
jgi:prepilin-type N-terminal cleavage/methylation domain-containing protein